MTIDRAVTEIDTSILNANIYSYWIFIGLNINSNKFVYVSNPNFLPFDGFKFTFNYKIRKKW